MKPGKKIFHRNDFRHSVDPFPPWREYKAYNWNWFGPANTPGYQFRTLRGESSGPWGI